MSATKLQPTNQKRNNNILNSFLVVFKRHAGILIGLLVICTIIAIRAPLFLSSTNLFNVLRQISENLYLASGMTIILIAGGIDLSIGGIIALTTILAAFFLQSNIPVPLVILICLSAGALVGSISGLIISRTKIIPFIVTLSMANILNGVSYIVTGANSVRIENRSWIALGTGYLGPIPLPVIYAVVILIIVYLILNRSRLGRHIYAVGGNETAARFSGINVKNIRLFIYIFSGVMAAIAGIVLSARAYSGNPLFGATAALDAIAAVVLGGISMAGGKGYISGTIIGALIIGVVNNGLNLMGVDSFWQMVFKGVIILIAVYMDYIRTLGKLQK